MWLSKSISAAAAALKWICDYVDLRAMAGRLIAVLSFMFGSLALMVGTAAPASGAGISFSSISTGGVHTCGLTQVGAAYCWGANTGGQLGDGTTTDRSTPVAVLGGLSFTSIATGNGNHTCGLATSGSVYCWGTGTSGQLGDNTNVSKLTPTLAMGGPYKAITVGYGYSCALTTSGVANCWGMNLVGQLGDNTTSSHWAPQAVLTGQTFVSISAGYDHICALTGTGVAYCWGGNAYGVLGDGTDVDKWTPTAVSTGLTFASISSGYHHECARTSGNVAYCWGINDNAQLGDGTTTQRWTPTAVNTALRFTVVTASNYHTCGIANSGVTYCWGFNYAGQLGSGNNTDSASPVVVTGSLSFATLTSGTSRTCGVTATGEGYCWGLNSNGQSGDGTTNNSNAPVGPIAIFQSGGTSVAINVPPFMAFAMTPVAVGVSCGDVSTTIASSSNSLPLGRLSINQQAIGGQRLSVTTNATNGYAVFVSVSAPFTGAATGRAVANVSGVNGSPSSWPASGTEAFGYTTESSTLSGTASRFHPGKWAQFTSSDAEVMRSTTMSALGGDTNCVAVQASTGSTTAADRYSGTLRFNAVPTF